PDSRTLAYLCDSRPRPGVNTMALAWPRGLFRLARLHPAYLRHLIAKKFAALARYRWAERSVGRDDRVPAPLGYKLVLTYRCNLRCVMCYEWGEVGWCHDEPGAAMARELDWGVVEKLLAEVGSRSPYFMLHGGEPLLYSRYQDLADLLKRHRCVSTT